MANNKPEDSDLPQNGGSSPSELAKTTPVVQVGSRFFQLLPKKLGAKHFVFQSFLLIPTLTFFVLIVGGIVPEPPQIDASLSGDMVSADAGCETPGLGVQDEPLLPDDGQANSGNLGTQTDKSEVVDHESTQSDKENGFLDQNWVVSGRLAILMTWWSLFALSVSACCSGLMMSNLARGGIDSREVEDGSLAFSIHVVGSVFGVVAVVIFLGGFVEGLLFPKLSDSGFRGIYFTMASPQNWAKLIVWAFIAGFVERLIPDLIGSLAKKVQSK